MDNCTITRLAPTDRASDNAWAGMAGRPAAVCAWIRPEPRTAIADKAAMAGRTRVFTPIIVPQRIGAVSEAGAYPGPTTVQLALRTAGAPPGNIKMPAYTFALKPFMHHTNSSPVDCLIQMMSAMKSAFTSPIPTIL